MVALEICCWRWACGEKDPVWSSVDFLTKFCSVFPLKGSHICPLGAPLYTSFVCILVSASVSYQAFSFSFLCLIQGFQTLHRYASELGRLRNVVGLSHGALNRGIDFNRSVEGMQLTAAVMWEALLHILFAPEVYFGMNECAGTLIHEYLLRSATGAVNSSQCFRDLKHNWLT